MEDTQLPHRGRGNGTVPVSHAPKNETTVVEIKGGTLAGFYVYGLINTPDRLEQGRMLVTHNLGGHRVRAIVPREYTHLKVKKMSNGSLFPRWKIGFRAAGSLPELMKIVEGRHPDVLLYTGERTTLKLEVGKGYAGFSHRPLNGGEATPLEGCNGPFRGTVELPGPGLIEVDCLVRWSATLHQRAVPT
ncbi:hypothetical protein ACIQM3_21030 [Streptomyces sp. NPDC091271]|uniref:hypothetical protein n=1 Tax=Streptomyces sp. NPDC091271 TaxID=3365980 RepID=UPI00382AF9BA